MTVEGSKWNYRKGVNEWSIKRMSLKPMMRVWYQFLKHNIMPTTHNETVNKARLVLLHCIIAGQKINVGRIIHQEIVNCSAKKSNEGMLYFPCLITELCKKNLVHVSGRDEVFQPTNSFDQKAIETLLKGNTGRKPRQQLPEATTSAAAVSQAVDAEEFMKFRKNMKTYWAWQARFSDWIEN
ncbi:hypothetical protein A2U01_0030570 [Trifolium medium]|uniref:Putative plant transposon protein domain-containing protein n=1 Tax=Trifolium medium TaxID=97028 RepID=A0A392PCH7_9FABA|nr:hypothetical protein [Trifolium medium]